MQQTWFILSGVCQQDNMTIVQAYKQAGGGRITREGQRANETDLYLARESDAYGISCILLSNIMLQMHHGIVDILPLHLSRHVR